MLVLERKKDNFFRCVFFLGSYGNIPPKELLTVPGPTRSFTVKKNYIGSAVFRNPSVNTDRRDWQIDILLLLYNDYLPWGNWLITNCIALSKSFRCGCTKLSICRYRDKSILLIIYFVLGQEILFEYLIEHPKYAPCLWFFVFMLISHNHFYY